MQSVYVPQLLVLFVCSVVARSPNWLVAFYKVLFFFVLIMIGDLAVIKALSCNGRHHAAAAAGGLLCH